MTPAAFVRQVRQTFEARRNPAQAVPMARYLKDQFPFLGLKRPEFQALLRPLRQPMEEPALLETAERLWRLPEREFQHAAIDLLEPRRLTPGALPTLRGLLEAKSWWDSVDGLTGHVLGPLIARERGMQQDMDAWSQEANFWLRRAAIIHQLGFKKATDAPRLFGYCAHNARDGEFFIRKAIGWALRSYARTDPAAVRAFVAAHPELSPLSRKEALKHL